jgi:hypothetical protein
MDVHGTSYISLSKNALIFHGRKHAKTPHGMAWREGTLGEAHRIDLGPANPLLPRGCEVPESHLAQKNLRDLTEDITEAHGNITGMTWIQSGIFLRGYH